MRLREPAPSPAPERAELLAIIAAGLNLSKERLINYCNADFFNYESLVLARKFSEPNLPGGVMHSTILWNGGYFSWQSD